MGGSEGGGERQAKLALLTEKRAALSALLHQRRRELGAAATVPRTLHRPSRPRGRYSHGCHAASELVQFQDGTIGPEP